MAKKNALITVVHNPDTNVLTFTVGEAGTIEIPVSDVPEEVRNRALLHGLVQKVSDAAAMPKSELTGNAKKDAKAKFDKMSAVATRILGGDWSRKAGDGTGQVSGIIFRAFSEYVEDMAKAKKKPIPDADKIRAVYDSKSRAGQLALRNVPEISAIMERLRSERGPSVSINTDELLGDLGL